MVLLVRISRQVFQTVAHSLSPLDRLDPPISSRLRDLAIASLVCWSRSITAGQLQAYTYHPLAQFTDDAQLSDLARDYDRSPLGNRRRHAHGLSLADHREPALPGPLSAAWGRGQLRSPAPGYRKAIRSQPCTGSSRGGCSDSRSTSQQGRCRPHRAGPVHATPSFHFKLLFMTIGGLNAVTFYSRRTVPSSAPMRPLMLRDARRSSPPSRSAPGLASSPLAAWTFYGPSGCEGQQTSLLLPALHDRTWRDEARQLPIRRVTLMMNVGIAENKLHRWLFFRHDSADESPNQVNYAYVNNTEPDNLVRMELAVEESFVQAAQPFVDGFGERRVVIDAHGERLDVLRLNAALSGTPAFEAALVNGPAGLPGSVTTRSHGCGLSRSTGPLARSSLFQTTFAVRDWRRYWRARKALRACRSCDGHVRHSPTRSRRGCVARPDARHRTWRHQPRSPDGYSRGPGHRRRTGPSVGDGTSPVFPAALLGGFGRRASGHVQCRNQRPRGRPSGCGGCAGARAGRRLKADDRFDRIPPAVLNRLPIPVRRWLTKALQADPLGSFTSVTDARTVFDEAFGETDPSEQDGLLLFMARCLALDVNTPPFPTDEETRAAGGPVAAGVDDVPDVDLGTRIEALKAFLASRSARTEGKTDSSSEAVRTDAPATAAHAATVAPPASVPPPASAAPPASVAPPPSPAPRPAMLTVEPAPSGLPLQASVIAAFEAEPPQPPVAEIAPEPTRASRLRTLISLQLPDDCAASTVDRRWRRACRRHRPRHGGRLTVAPQPLNRIVFNRHPASRRGRDNRQHTPGRDTACARIDSRRSRRGSRHRERSSRDSSDHSRRQRVVAVPRDDGNSAVGATATANELRIRTEPIGAAVTVDGRYVGRSPVSVNDLLPDRTRW